MAKSQNNKSQPALFDSRFLESYAGSSIVSDKKIAIIELIANSWDSAATEVYITWPLNEGDPFRITDNGHGMTREEFMLRFRTLSYNRISNQGGYAEVPEDHKKMIGKRPAFGKHGKGRFGGFAFGESFLVKTWKKGFSNTFKVFINHKNELQFQPIKENEPMDGHGTEITVENTYNLKIQTEIAKQEIGMRFLTDPYFEVYINNQLITFHDIPNENILELLVEVEGCQSLKITAIDVQNTDKTTHQHGIAWHVNRRLVGECTWRGSGSEYLVDGRRIAAKRYIFIVQADCLSDATLPDWSGFYPNNNKWQEVSEEVHKVIKSYILYLTKGQREENFKKIEDATKPTLKKIGIVGREKWEEFMMGVQEECPSISYDELEKIGVLLAKLEQSRSKYSLITLLANSSVEELENLKEILDKWDIDFAKVVLDEIEYRMKLVENLQIKVLKETTDEVLELQPLFHRGLWIFGPEYETIEFTSNQGMTSVIQNLYKNYTLKGSLNRPDFAIIPDGTVGLYSLNGFDDDGAEVGINRLTIIELKRPGVPIGEEQKSQCWKYVQELIKKGMINTKTNVRCFVLGSTLDAFDSGESTHNNGNVKILPMAYDTVIKRATSRLHNLHQKVKEAPFLQDERIKHYIAEKAQIELEIP